MQPDLEDFTACFLRIYHRLSINSIPRNRLFAKHVFVRVKRGDSRTGVEIVRRADAHRIEFFHLHQFLVIAEDMRNFMLFGERLRTRFVNVTGGDNRNAFDALMAGEVFAARDATATDNTDSDLFHIFSFVNASDAGRQALQARQVL